MNQPQLAHVKPFRFWCQKVIPLVYDDALSYYEAIEKISYKLNEIIAVLNEYDQGLKEYIDTNLSNLKAYVDNQDSTLEAQYQQAVQEAISKAESELAAAMNQHEQDILKLYQYVNQLNQEVYNYISQDQKRQDITHKAWLLQMYEQIEAAIKDVNALIHNPVRGTQTNVQTAINDLYNVLRYQAFDCITFDTMDEMAIWWDDKGYTAFEFDLYGYYRYGYPKCFCYMMNPYTGELDLIQNVLSQTISRTANSVTASEFDALTYLTTSYYDGLGMDAYIADFENKPILTKAPSTQEAQA